MPKQKEVMKTPSRESVENDIKEYVKFNPELRFALMGINPNEPYSGGLGIPPDFYVKLAKIILLAITGVAVKSVISRAAKFIRKYIRTKKSIANPHARKLVIEIVHKYSVSIENTNSA